MIRLLHRVLSTGITALAFTTATFVSYTLAFGLTRAIALPILFQIPLVSHLFRPFLGHFIRGRWSLLLLWRNRTLAWHSFLLGLTTISAWEFAESLFDEKVQEVSVLLCRHNYSLTFTSIAFGCCIEHCRPPTHAYFWYHKQ